MPSASTNTMYASSRLFAGVGTVTYTRESGLSNPDCALGAATFNARCSVECEVLEPPPPPFPPPPGAPESEARPPPPPTSPPPRFDVNIPGCFPADAQVLLADGSTTSISNLRHGDQVAVPLGANTARGGVRIEGDTSDALSSSPILAFSHRGEPADGSTTIIKVGCFRSDPRLSS